MSAVDVLDDALDVLELAIAAIRRARTAGDRAELDRLRAVLGTPAKSEIDATREALDAEAERIRRGETT